MRFALLDTNIYIGHWMHGLYAADLAALRKAYIIRQSSVVLSELRRGVRSRSVLRMIESLYRFSAGQWTPAADDWWDAGCLISKLGNAGGWDAAKRRDFQNDALIALTARRHGAVVVTANRADFELLGKELGITVVHV